MNNEVTHTFAICAYGKSPYLRECIESVLEQDRPESEVFIATSTPSEYIESLAAEYGLPVHVNTGEHGIGQDWNFAYSCATGDYVTIAHQDDVYLPGYAQEAVRMLSAVPDALIFFSDYGELRNGVPVTENRNLKIKRMLLRPLRDGRNANKRWAKRRALSLGSAISCPAVTFVRASCPNPPFQTQMSCSLDWDTWEHLSRLDGSFMHSTKVLMYHRIHEESATTELIHNNVRGKEDQEMFGRFWPTPIARLLARAYSQSEKNNDV